MKSTVFASLPEARRADVKRVFEAWTRAGSKPDILEEGLKRLSSDSREPAYSILASEDPVADICCAYGKGARARLSLTKKDASMLLRIVERIRKAGTDERTASSMISRAFEILIGGSIPLNGQADEASRRLLDVMGITDPILRQGSLF